MSIYFMTKIFLKGRIFRWEKKSELSYKLWRISKSNKLKTSISLRKTDLKASWPRENMNSVTKNNSLEDYLFNIRPWKERSENHQRLIKVQRIQQNAEQLLSLKLSLRKIFLTRLIAHDHSIFISQSPLLSISTNLHSFKYSLICFFLYCIL